MAKPTKYPKKFRQKLEKIRDARDRRDGNDIDPFRTFAMTALAAWRGLHLYSRFSDPDESFKVYQNFFWKPRGEKAPVDTVTTPPPWVKANG